MRTTWFEQGEAKGQRKILAAQLEDRFGPLSPQVRDRLESLPSDRLEDLARALLRAQSLKELGLAD